MSDVATYMTRGIRSMEPDDSIQLAAQAMDELNVGAVPVIEAGRLVGMVTDRDIALRAVAQGLAPADTVLRDVMSANVRTCFEDQPIDEVLGQMRESQIRRLPVVDRAQRVVGMLSLGDIAAKAGAMDASRALEAISTPAEPDRSNLTAASGPAGGGDASGVASSHMPA